MNSGLTEHLVMNLASYLFSKRTIKAKLKIIKKMLLIELYIATEQQNQNFQKYTQSVNSIVILKIQGKCNPVSATERDGYRKRDA